jgi:hypothetical protein
MTSARMTIHCGMASNVGIGSDGFVLKGTLSFR